MRAFLRVAETKEDDDPRLQEWVKQVREAAYDIEDALDEFMFLFARHHPHGFFGCFWRILHYIKNLRDSHVVASEIQNIKSRITNISEGHQRYRFEYGTPHHFLGSPPISNTRWDDALVVGKEKLVGIQLPKEELISQLLDDDDSWLKVIAVLGMQGLRKTTLVKNIHEDSKVQNHFQISAWVTASETCGIKDLLKDLTRQIYEHIKKPIANILESITSTEYLKSFVRDFLRGKRYEIVLDDVCDKDIWNSIKSAFPDNNYCSRVMLTTQTHDVAASAESQGCIYRMKPLPLKESWNLFCHKTFKDNSCLGYLKHIVEDILRKCRGLPLAIVAVGGLLALKDKD